MEQIVAALRDQQDELDALVATADETALQRPSRCPGWSVGDVLLHLAQTNEMAVASVAHRLPQFIDAAASDLPGTGTGTGTGNVDDWAGALVDAQRTTGTDARDRWQRSAAAQADAFAHAEPTTRVLWVAGELATRSLASTRLSETWIHTVDVAAGFGIDLEPTDRLWHIARLAWRTIPYAFSQAGLEPQGSVAFMLRGPDGTTWDFGDGDHADTVVTGTALDLCAVAGQRAHAADTDLAASGPDSHDVLRLVRTFA